MTMARGSISTILALLALATMPVAAPGYLPPGFIGVSPQNPGTGKDYRLMREADVSSVRLPLYWAGIEPQNPAFSEPQWGGFDHEVRLAAENELEAFPFITASPKWVAPLGIDLPVTTPRQRRAWAGFVGGGVTRSGAGGAA